MFTIDLPPIDTPAAKPEKKARAFYTRPDSAHEAAHDEQLVARFKAGDESAFAEISDRYRSKLLSLAHNFLHDDCEAEEAAQDTLIRAHRGLVNFRGDSSLCTWLHRILMNVARNRYWFLRRRGRGNNLSLDVSPAEGGDTLAASFCSSEPDPTQELTRTEFAELTSRCMAKLSPSHREILTLRNVDDLGYEEIARRLSLHQGTVKSRIARAREFLRRAIMEEYPEFDERLANSDWFEPIRARQPSGPLAMVA